MHSLRNTLLQINIKNKGAELCNMTSVKHNTEFIWQANPKIWASHAPNLFPIIGSLKNDTYTYNNKFYQMPKHGFVRHNDDFTIKNRTETSITFSLVSNDALYKIYPFLFSFEITYTLLNNQLTINHTVTNADDKTLYFSLGGHPAFNCPISNDELYTDYYLEFEHSEDTTSYLLNRISGLITNQTKLIFKEGNKINLQPDLFNEDALIFKDLNSRIVSLKHKTKGKILALKFKDFKQLGIWAKPNAPYVCIEPWLGIADNETTDQKIENKEGILSLDAGATFEASYSIEIENSLLS
ncbi:aldose 1-epimerase family protein [Winogradskyella bathintestinalis]|uniref:Aldose 1-epimerase family protein n=1 Tax=Winogradskyella bathintestinalis TaxID=3035208 RepID=A0ABT7ZVM2_9FLAO|nr:aldose 1-epimerase family protein [Winogradskyella bathintestinalis]MDN3493081.1 aldose 1-epimerase family protein [Winogradskyella bathintestinalis]